MAHPAPPDHNTVKHRNQLVLEYLQVRRALGLLGFVLPAALLVYAALPAGAMQASISEFYYTHMGGFLVGCLCAIGGVFLASYKGYPRDKSKNEWLSDRVLTLAAGLGAVGVALFPVRNPARRICVTTRSPWGGWNATRACCISDRPHCFWA